MSTLQKVGFDQYRFADIISDETKGLKFFRKYIAVSKKWKMV